MHQFSYQYISGTNRFLHANYASLTTIDDRNVLFFFFHFHFLISPILQGYNATYSLNFFKFSYFFLSLPPSSSNNKIKHDPWVFLCLRIACVFKLVFTTTYISILQQSTKISYPRRVNLFEAMISVRKYITQIHRLQDRQRSINAIR